MAKVVDLSELMSFIGLRWVCTAEQYPDFDALSRERQRVYTLTHVLLHMNKATGRVASAIEPGGHGDQVDEIELKQAVGKLLTSTLKLAYLLGMKPEQLADLAETNVRFPL